MLKNGNIKNESLKRFFEKNEKYFKRNKQCNII